MRFPWNRRRRQRRVCDYEIIDVLTQRGSATAATITRDLRADLGDVYEALTALIYRGIIVETSTAPEGNPPLRTITYHLRET